MSGISIDAGRGSSPPDLYLDAGSSSRPLIPARFGTLARSPSLFAPPLSAPLLPRLLLVRVAYSPGCLPVMWSESWGTAGAHRRCDIFVRCYAVARIGSGSFSSGLLWVPFDFRRFLAQSLAWLLAFRLSPAWLLATLLLVPWPLV